MIEWVLAEQQQRSGKTAAKQKKTNAVPRFVL